MVDGALLDLELDQAGLELAPGWEESFNIVRINDLTYIEVTVSTKKVGGEATCQSLSPKPRGLNARREKQVAMTP